MRGKKKKRDRFVMVMMHLKDSSGNIKEVVHMQISLEEGDW